MVWGSVVINGIDSCCLLLNIVQRNQKLEDRKKTCGVLHNTDHRLQCNEFVLGAVPWSLDASQNYFCCMLGQRSLKPINPGMSRENQYESDPYPRACLSCCVMCCCGLQVCAFLIVKFFHLYLLLLNKNFSLFLIIFFQYITCEVRKPLFGYHKFLENRFHFILFIYPSLLVFSSNPNFLCLQIIELFNQWIVHHYCHGETQVPCLTCNLSKIWTHTV